MHIVTQLVDPVEDAVDADLVTFVDGLVRVHDKGLSNVGEFIDEHDKIPMRHG